MYRLHPRTALARSLQGRAGGWTQTETCMNKPRARLRIGVGAGMADDRIGPALQLLEQCDLDYLVCECLAERTIARETLSRKHDGARGYNPMLEARMGAFLPTCRRPGVRLVSNMGDATPVGGAAGRRGSG